eukprot:COSAG02_NODE_601_length_19715_cov_445.701315_2_plen_121_part_00
MLHQLPCLPRCERASERTGTGHARGAIISAIISRRPWHRNPDERNPDDERLQAVLALQLVLELVLELQLVLVGPAVSGAIIIGHRHRHRHRHHHRIVLVGPPVGGNTVRSQNHRYFVSDL